MQRFRVTLETRREYAFDVEAETQWQARRLAEKQVEKLEDGFESRLIEIDVTEAELVD